MKIYFVFLLFFGFIIDLKSAKGKLLMVVGLIRHGARTPLKNWDDFGKYFPTLSQGQITTNGWRQEILLGKYMRHKYLINKYNVEMKDFIDLNDINNQFFLISSPTQRTIDSSIGFSLGLLPDHIFKIIDKNYENYKNDDIPPINNYQDITPDFRFLIGKKNIDTLFHGKKCVFPESLDLGNNPYKKKEFLSLEEKEKLHVFFKDVFPKSQKFDGIQKEQVYKSMYNAIRALNYQFKQEIILVPLELQKILNKSVLLSAYRKSIFNDKINMIMNSEFFENLIYLFDSKINSISGQSITFYEEEFQNLKLVTFVGHDSNLMGIIKNLLNPDYINELLDNKSEDFDTFEFLMPKFSSLIEFQLFQYDEEYYVKIYLNGMQKFENLRGNIKYDFDKGILYHEFKELLKSRILPEYTQCIKLKEKKKK